ncbi:hypothetical protein AK812_SmicGene21573 [Symbiodinium microadriaticum]|uniref:Uncharacterized protein n=1 Tax=Symbiodinium microadriaticum TaxID=2951 RepID=A0A1Q9DM53_SYMMI|nr:hypothetical protein AK812_SmicGene21573 [Symbiodinium microadriaticum]
MYEPIPPVPVNCVHLSKFGTNSTQWVVRRGPRPRLAMALRQLLPPLYLAIIASCRFQLENQISPWCVGVSLESRRRANEVIAKRCDASDDSQLWEWKNETQLWNLATGKCLAIQSGGDGWAYVETCRNPFLYDQHAWSWTSYRALLSNRTNQCLDIQGDPPNIEGAHLGDWPCETRPGNTDHRWREVPKDYFCEDFGDDKCMAALGEGYFTRRDRSSSCRRRQCATSDCCELHTCYAAACENMGQLKVHRRRRVSCAEYTCSVQGCCDRTCMHHQSCPNGTAVHDPNMTCGLNEEGVDDTANCTEQCCTNYTTTLTSTTQTFTTQTFTSTTGCSTHADCRGRAASVGGATVAATFCDTSALPGQCVPNPATFFMSSLASWHLAAQLNTLQGASATIQYTYEASMRRESGEEVSREDAQGVEEATEKSLSFVLSTTVHREAKDCLERLEQVVREDCGQEAGAGFGQALRKGISAVGDVAAGVVEAFPVASTVVQGISAAAGPILGLFGIKEEECDPVTLGEKTTNCITSGTSETRSTEEQEAYTRAKRSTTTDVKRLAENVGRGESVVQSQLPKVSRFGSFTSTLRQPTWSIPSTRGSASSA